ncbi:MAG TPA: retropepsin-like aspartic protease [Saprospiraceae bacterium]|nr:retropepsin-like aspartic protease [Saprospiraceae bacterium]
MKKFPFDLSTDEDLILLPVLINDYEIRLALDTAATQTIVDFNVLLMLGYTSVDALATRKLETANGIMEAQMFRVSEIETLERCLVEFEILSYDFLQKGLLSTYDGVLGLDFFRFAGRLTIDFKEQMLWFSE